MPCIRWYDGAFKQVNIALTIFIRRKSFVRINFHHFSASAADYSQHQYVLNLLIIFS